MIHVPAGIYLYTGRKTISSAPAESSYAPSVFAAPGKYLSEAILRDAVTVVISHHPDHSIATEVAAVISKCPQALQPLNSLDQPGYRKFYRVGPEVGCLQQLFSPQLSDSRS